MIVLLLIVTVVLLIAAFFLGLAAKARQKEHAEKIQTIRKRGQAGGECPVCGSTLYGKEKIISRIFEGGREKDRLCHILGCPHCQPEPEPGVTRRCPVCKKEVPDSGHLISRLFLRNDGSQHVHVVGCTECHKK